MKLKPILTCILASGLIPLNVDADPIERRALDPAAPIVIPVGSKSATTVQFPRPIQGIFGYGLTTGETPGTYHYAHPNESRLLTFRNLIPDKETFVSVLLGKEDLYVLHLKPSANPPLAVHLQDPNALSRQRQARQVEADALAERQLDPDTARLFNLLKLGKNERSFRIALPHLYQEVESRKVEYRHDDDSVATVVTKLHRFPKEDAVFLNGHIENRTDHDLQFDPGSLQVEVGSRTYPVALVDAAAEIPTKGKIPVHVIVRGGSEGERAHLSIKNEFRLIMPAYAPCTDDPALTDQLGQVLLPPSSDDGPDAGLLGEPDSKGGSK